MANDKSNSVAEQLLDAFKLVDERYKSLEEKVFAKLGGRNRFSKLLPVDPTATVLAASSNTGFDEVFSEAFDVSMCSEHLFQVILNPATNQLCEYQYTALTTYSPAEIQVLTPKGWSGFLSCKGNAGVGARPNWDKCVKVSGNLERVRIKTVTYAGFADVLGYYYLGLV